MTRVYTDPGWRTGLGTGFYDRLRELGELEEALGCARTIVVYGPRNVGKSELVRYLLARRLGAKAIVVDARRRAAERLGLYEPPERLTERLARLAAGVARLPRGLVEVVEAAVRLANPPDVIVLDELHLLYGGLRDALRDLEAVAGLLAKEAGVRTRLVVTVSEGFFATLEVQQRLVGYSTVYTLVEPMDPGSFELLYGEYRRLYGCNTSLDTIVRLAGCSPGYLPDLCPRTPRLLEEWVAERLQQLWSGLRRAAAEAGMSLGEAVEAAKRLLDGLEPRDAREEMLAEKLVEANIAYPCPAHPRRYAPQLPVYRAALEAGPGAKTLGELLAHARRPPRCRG